jgi:rubrerythrin
MKNIFSCRICGDIHIGSLAPDVCGSCHSIESYTKAEKNDVIAELDNRSDKKLGRCTVCNDLHIGLNFPVSCPTCKNDNVYVEIEKTEFEKIIEYEI